MRRTYLRSLILSGIMVMTGPLLPHASTAKSLFESKPLLQDQFIVLGRPIGDSQWTLLVLEQIKPEPRCWVQRTDGLIDPSLNRFNFTGICGRYIDSNGYSLRSGGEDQGSRVRLRLRQQAGELLLETSPWQHPSSVVIGQAPIPLRDPNGFIRIRLNPGWRLERRVYLGKPLGHLYFAHPEAWDRLVSQADWHSAS